VSLDQVDPLMVIAIAGPNGAGKSTFYLKELASAGLTFVNADEIAKADRVDAYEAARRAAQQRNDLVRDRESFVFETVFSDPVGEKIDFLLRAAREGYAVAVVFIGLNSPKLSEERVAARRMAGGHDVPTAKLKARYARTMKNLERAVRVLPRVDVFDNSDPLDPYRKVAQYRLGRMLHAYGPLPDWLPGGLRR
jgi:predicted ABC-type ATPase